MPHAGWLALRRPAGGYPTQSLECHGPVKASSVMGRQARVAAARRDAEETSDHDARCRSDHSLRCRSSGRETAFPVPRLATGACRNVLSCRGWPSQQAAQGCCVHTGPPTGSGLRRPPPWMPLGKTNRRAQHSSPLPPIDVRLGSRHGDLLKCFHLPGDYYQLFG